MESKDGLSASAVAYQEYDRKAAAASSLSFLLEGGLSVR